MLPATQFGLLLRFALVDLPLDRIPHFLGHPLRLGLPLFIGRFVTARNDSQKKSEKNDASHSDAPPRSSFAMRLAANNSDNPIFIITRNLTVRREWKTQESLFV